MNSDAKTEEGSFDEVNKWIREYLDGVKKEFEERCSKWPISIANPAPGEVTIGLFRRQYSLACHIAANPGIWTPDVAPILLRCMVEVYIWLAWILESPDERAKLYIEDGLGKEKLILMHRADELEQQGMNPDDDIMVQNSNDWIEHQKISFLVDVNTGTWSGLDARKMAGECGCRDFYRFTYYMFSTAMHSSWNHVSRFDLQHCASPFHAFHKIPRKDFLPPTSFNFRLAAKYLDRTFELVDKKLNLDVPPPEVFYKSFRGTEDYFRKTPYYLTKPGGKSHIAVMDSNARLVPICQRYSFKDSEKYTKNTQPSASICKRCADHKDKFI